MSRQHCEQSQHVSFLDSQVFLCVWIGRFAIDRACIWLLLHDNVHQCLTRIQTSCHHSVLVLLAPTVIVKPVLTRNVHCLSTLVSTLQLMQAGNALGVLQVEVWSRIDGVAHQLSSAETEKHM